MLTLVYMGVLLDAWHEPLSKHCQPPPPKETQTKTKTNISLKCKSFSNKSDFSSSGIWVCNLAMPQSFYARLLGLQHSLQGSKDHSRRVTSVLVLDHSQCKIYTLE